MVGKTIVTCRCGTVKLEVTGPPAMSNECLCDSCRQAAAIFANLPDGANIADEKGATHVLVCRVDRLACPKGAPELKSHRLTPDSKTRRIVAACCNTPMFLDFEPGQWVSIYATNWPKDALPPVQFRTFCDDLPDMSTLPKDVPNGSPVPLGVVRRLLWMAIGLGFRQPKITFVEGTLDD